MNLSMARAEQHVKDSQRLIAEVAEDEALLSDLAAGLGAPRLSRARVDRQQGRLEVPARADPHLLAGLTASDHVSHPTPYDHGVWRRARLARTSPCSGRASSRIGDSVTPTCLGSRP